MSHPPFTIAKIFCSVMTFLVEIFKDLTFCVEKLRSKLFLVAKLFSSNGHMANINAGTEQYYILITDPWRSCLRGGPRRRRPPRGRGG